jgi:hypothetical protein
MDHDAVADSHLPVLIRAGGGSAAMRVPAGYRAIAQRVVARLVEVSALGNDGSFLTQKST